MMELRLSLEKQYFSNGGWGLISKQEANFVGHKLLFLFFLKKRVCACAEM